MLMAVAGVWIAVQGDGATEPESSAAAEAALMEMPPGNQVTLQFFRNPALVAPISMQTLDGQPLASSAWRGKVTLVNFWATWCGPCRAAVPRLIALQRIQEDA